MYIRPVTEADINEIQSWLDYRDPATVDVDLKALPTTGAFCPGVGVMYYALCVSAPVMWIDSFVTNPRASLQERRELMKHFAAIIFCLARDNKIKRLLFLTKKDQAVVMRWYAKHTGVKPVGEFMLYRCDYSWD